MKRRWAASAARTVAIAALACIGMTAATAAMAQSLPPRYTSPNPMTPSERSQYLATSRSLGVPSYNAPASEPSNVCFLERRYHRWCRVFLSEAQRWGGGTCFCGEAGAPPVFQGRLITESMLAALLSDNEQRAEVGANGKQYSREYRGF